MGVKKFTDFHEYVTKLVRCGLVAELQPGVVPNFLTFGIVIKVKVRELRIGNAHKGIIQSAYSSGAKPDLFHGSQRTTKAAKVSHAHRLRRIQSYRTDQVFNGFLGGQGYGYTAHAETC